MEINRLKMWDAGGNAFDSLRGKKNTRDTNIFLDEPELNVVPFTKIDREGWDLCLILVARMYGLFMLFR